MSTDIDELQERVGAAELSEGPPNRRGEQALETGQRIMGHLDATPSVSAKFDHKQWMTGPNGRFMAAGTTTQKLPPAVYAVEFDGNGNLWFQTKQTLTDNLIELDDSPSIRIVKGIQMFWEKKAEFKKRGILYKRGILMWGAPGSGKTVTVAFLMRDIVARGGLVLLAEGPPENIGIALTIMRRIEPERPLIVVFEDVEEITNRWGEAAILSILDGEHQVENVVNIATTNYPERLGARIVNRPSRFDEVIKVGMPTEKTRKKYLQSTVGELGEAEINRWVADTDGLSLAHLREIVVATQCFGRTYEETLDRLKKMCKLPTSDREGKSAVGLLTK